MGEGEVEMFGISMREVRSLPYCLMLVLQVTDLLCHDPDLSEKSKIQESTLVHWICESTLVTILSFSTCAAIFILILKFSAALYLIHLENSFLLVLLLRPVHPIFFCEGGIEDRSPHEGVASKGKGHSLSTPNCFPWSLDFCRNLFLVLHSEECTLPLNL